MKKIVAFAGFSLLAVGAFAQTNLQVFYDFGEDRKHVTSTLEMFKGDDWGSTFFFVTISPRESVMRKTLWELSQTRISMVQGLLEAILKLPVP